MSEEKKSGQAQIEVTEDPHDKDPFKKKHKKTKENSESEKKEG